MTDGVVWRPQGEDGDVVLPEDMVLAGTAGTGIKLGDKISNEFGWHDIQGEIIVRGIGGSSPTWAQIGATGFYAYEFSIGDEVWIDFHITHDQVLGTDLFKHVHWFTDGTQTNSVKWQYDWTYASRDTGHFDFASPSSVTMEGTPDGSVYNHVVSEQVSGSTVTGLEVDGILSCHLVRITNGGTNNTDGVYLRRADVHYQSTGRPTLNKVSPFD